ncbi:MAG: phosphoglycerate dehydrogenase [Mucilaginibacter polytrichastri]|nr:phosphoglycerate dehydrogenase [Mucilaginibacter polytrichastri]
MTKRILIVDDLHPVFQQEAEKLGYTCELHENLSHDEFLALLPGFSGIAVRSRFNIDRNVMDTATQLRFICRAGAGMDNIDEIYAREKGIVCLNAPEGNADAVGEHALGMLLALMNNFRNGDRQIRNGLWDREANRGYELCGKTVAVIGYGNMGRSFCAKLAGFGVNILVYDKYKTGFSHDHVREASMEEVVKHADVLSLHIPLTIETRQLVNDEYLFHFRKPIFFINTARGEVVNTQSVLNAIASGKILGAGLDVLEKEKYPALAEQPWYNHLITNEKVILSPHVAGWTFDSYRRISEVLAEKLKNLDSTT